MKIVLTNEPTFDIPKIGDIWKHPNYNSVYMRIEENGTINVTNVGSGYFCNVELNTGRLVKAINSNSCVILKSDNDTLRI